MSDGIPGDEEQTEKPPRGNGSELEAVVMRLRGQIQNCVNHLERAKRHSYGNERDGYDEAIASANKALYETLGV